ncbi:acetylglutamate kinase [Myxococcota bacterium]|nr:acetylglutamate kinase [Myxococcota bacterium]
MSALLIKIGGEVFLGDELQAVAADTASAVRDGHRVVLVHGGGPQATALQKALGQTPQVVGGRRITDAATLDVMKMVVGGKLNMDLCSALTAAGVRPVGLTGASSQAVAATKRPPRVVSGGGPEPIDFGLVGDITGVNGPLLELLWSAGYVPVVACLAADARGQILNVNADIVANQIGRHLRVDHVVLVTGAPGVLRDIGDPASRLPRLTLAEARAAIADGTVTGGMIPKLEESMAVLEGDGIAMVHIVGKIRPGDIRRAIDEPGSIGTTLVP